MRLLGLTCGLLAAIVAAELSHFGTDDEQGVRRGTGEARRVPGDTVRSTAPEASAVERWATVSLARPLFARDRRPDVKQTSAVQAELPRLAGIITTPSQRVAIFEPPGGAKPVLVEPGQIVAGWKITAVSGEEVDLEQGGHALALAPQYRTALAGNTTTRVVRPPPRWEVAAESGLLRARWSNPHLQP
ncbi:MAG: hypothetical protein JOZ42_15585 [Acetobacteraceae bacterium]|nr:hypothetical protein [Acetobacteraceae bacterium]